jgi:hypothetical protein
MEIHRKPYLFYRHRLYPKLKDYRGFTRIKIWLKKIAAIDLEKIGEEPESITDKEWDNLIILDAARHDTYEQIEGETDYRISVGSATPEFIEKTFSEGDFSDVVYISGNPHFYPDIFRELTGRDLEETFHEVYNTYETDWNEKEGVVLPEPLVRDAKSAEKLFPDKRKIIHMMQPHVPFVKSKYQQSPNDPISENTDIEVEENPESEIMLAEKGEIPADETKEHYRNNLEYVLPHAKKLAEELDGKTVITSDHGELLDEKGLYGHPPGFKLEKLRKVPWDVI